METANITFAINPNIHRAIAITEFFDYVLSFYNDVDGLYPLASYEDISEAVWGYVENKPDLYDFDSIDREHVRRIIEIKYATK